MLFIFISITSPFFFYLDFVCFLFYFQVVEAKKPSNFKANQVTNFNLDPCSKIFSSFTEVAREKGKDQGKAKKR
jgi:hypothetical protein